MKTKKTVLAFGLFLFLGMNLAVYGQDKYGSDPEKCKTNLSLFNEAAKMKNYEAAYEPWKWCLDNCLKASKVIYSSGLKMIETKYNKNAGLSQQERFY